LPPSTSTLRAAATLRRGQWLRERFPQRSWLAVELHRGASDEMRLARCLELAAQCGLPAVAAGDVHMHRRSRRRLRI
jgi:error-prone DNA polymerase